MQDARGSEESRDRKATILIVGKEKILVDLLVHALKSDEVSVLGVTDAEQAQQLVEMHSIDLVVLDLSIVNVPLFVGRLRQQHNSIKIVGLAATGDVHTSAQEAGVTTFLDKSQGVDALVSEVHKSLSTDFPLLASGNSVRILVVDDEAEIRDVITEYLTGQGYSTLVAENGREAEERVQSDPGINLVLLDVSMPGTGGIEALTAIMSRDPHPSVIMMTAVADREIARQALKTGAFDYILKPFDFASIEATIVACIRHAEYNKQPWWKRLTPRS